MTGNSWVAGFVRLNVAGFSPRGSLALLSLSPSGHLSFDTAVEKASLSAAQFKSETEFLCQCFHFQLLFQILPCVIGVLSKYYMYLAIKNVLIYQTFGMTTPHCSTVLLAFY